MSAAAKKAAPTEAPAPSEAKPSIPELAKRWATAKAQEELAAREVESLKAQLLEAGVKDGYADAFLEVNETSDLDLENAKLRQAIFDHGAWIDAHEFRLSKKNVHALAQTSQAIARAVKSATSTKLRFNQVAKKET